MKLRKHLLIIAILMISVLGFPQSNSKNAYFGEDKLTIYSYFTPTITNFQITTFKRSIFKLGINSKGDVTHVNAVNHSFNQNQEAIHSQGKNF